VGAMYQFFAAEDDEAATLMLTKAWPPPTFSDEGLPSDVLAHLEALVTGRSVQEIESDPRHEGQIAEQVDESAGVPVCGVLTVTDTLAHALTTADVSVLIARSAIWQDWGSTVRGLASVARHAAAHGHHMYCFWTL
jgi:hypothetical protein